MLNISNIREVLQSDELKYISQRQELFNNYNFVDALIYLPNIAKFIDLMKTDRHLAVLYNRAIYHITTDDNENNDEVYYRIMALCIEKVIKLPCLYDILFWADDMDFNTYTTILKSVYHYNPIIYKKHDAFLDLCRFAETKYNMWKYISVGITYIKPRANMLFQIINRNYPVNILDLILSYVIDINATDFRGYNLLDILIEANRNVLTDETKKTAVWLIQNGVKYPSRVIRAMKKSDRAKHDREWKIWINLVFNR
jgi:hypothetical protein